jgi:hypothetical protein
MWLHAPRAKNKTTTETEKFHDQPKDVISKCEQRGREAVMGGDFSARAGTRDECGMKRSNKQLNLAAASTSKMSAATWPLTRPWQPP